MSPTNIFILGATGYIGGTLLVVLLEQYPTATFTALVRKHEAGQLVKALAPERITIAHGSHSDDALIQTHVEKADLVLNIADADDLELTKSIVNGLKKKSQKGVLIHTSGSAVIVPPEGPHEGKLGPVDHKVWDDTNTEDIRGIPASAYHRVVDLAVFEAHEAGVADTYIVCPGLIYGTGTGPVKTTSIQLPGLIQIALRRREVVHIGEGSNIWCHIHLQDLIRLYIQLIHHAFAQLKSNAKVDAYDNFYFAASGESVIKDLTEPLAALLYKKGLVDTSHARGIAVDEEKMLSLLLGHTSRAVAKRAELLGWSAKEKRLNDPEVLQTDIEHILKVVQSA